MKKPWNDPKYVSWTPVLTIFLLEGANVQQIIQMWTHLTSAGQSLTGWMCVNAALCLWCNFYRVVAPEQNKKAFWSCLFGVFINSLVIASVIFFRATGRG